MRAALVNRSASGGPEIAATSGCSKGSGGHHAESSRGRHNLQLPSGACSAILGLALKSLARSRSHTGAVEAGSVILALHFWQERGEA